MGLYVPHKRELLAALEEAGKISANTVEAIKTTPATAVKELVHPAAMLCVKKERQKRRQGQKYIDQRRATTCAFSAR